MCVMRHTQRDHIQWNLWSTILQMPRLWIRPSHWLMPVVELGCFTHVQNLPNLVYVPLYTYCQVLRLPDALAYVPMHLDLSRCPLLHQSLQPPPVLRTVRVVIQPKSSGWSLWWIWMDCIGYGEEIWSWFSFQTIWALIGNLYIMDESRHWFSLCSILCIKFGYILGAFDLT